MKELTAYLDRINNDPRNVETYGHPFDLTWKWAGSGDEPMIVVYEEADRHELASGTKETIIGNVRGSLEHWHLADPDA